MSRRASRSGVTLVELMVVLVLLGIMAGITGLAFGDMGAEPAVDEPMARLAAARREALRIGRPATVSVVVSGVTYAATAFPDGSVFADSVFAVDPLSGRPDGTP